MSRGREGIKRDCRHPRAYHEHGTVNAYILDRCRCAPCSAAKAADVKRHRHAVQTGRYHGLVDAEPVRLHLLSLSYANIGRVNLVTQTGVSHYTITEILQGRRRRVREDTARRLLAVTAPVRPDTAVDGTGAMRRLQAMVACGWAPIELARRLGMDTDTAANLLHRTRVRLRTDRAVRELYELLWDIAPPAKTAQQRRNITRAKAMAERYGWPPPLAWDDDTIDDPDAQPQAGEPVDVDDARVVRVIAGEPLALNPAEAIAVVTRLHHAGLDDTQIGHRMGRTPAAVFKIRSRHLPETVNRKVS